VESQQYAEKIEELDFYREAKLGELAFYALGAAEEAGEVAGKVKKFYRDAGHAPVTFRDIAIEIGDALWYLTRLAAKMGFSIDEIRDMNIKKLEDRKARGTQRGSGDSR